MTCSCVYWEAVAAGTFVLVHGIRLYQRKGVLLGEEEAELLLGLLLAPTAVELVEGLAIHRKLGPQTDRRDTHRTSDKQIGRAHV